MKIRNGFVSNSSSSSFICDVCGQDASGYDMGLSEAEMYQCANSHVFCEEHALNCDDEKEFVINLITDSIIIAKNSDNDYYKERINEYEELLLEINNNEDNDFDQIKEDFDFRDSFPTKYCPICQMEHVTDDDMVKFLLTKHNLTMDGVKSEIKDKFKSYKEFMDYSKYGRL